jgi:6-phosphogluconolactonase
MTSTNGREVEAFPDLEALSDAAAEIIVDIARDSVQARGRFSIALAGGNTPKRTYQLLVERHRDEIDWPRWQVFFGDERFVPSDDKRSNYRMARDALLAAAPIPAGHVHPIPTDTPTVGDSADSYEQTLRHVLAADDTQPSAIDLVLLGVGPDGHTASLFPGSPVVAERARWARAVEAPTTVQPAVPRVTLTLPCLNGARNVLFLIAGNDKRPVVVEILQGGEAAQRYPAAMVRAAGRTVWLVEQSAMPPREPNT